MPTTSSTTLAEPNHALSSRPAGGHGGAFRFWVPFAILSWFALALTAAQAGFFKPAAGQPPMEFLVSLAIPVALFALIYRLSAAFRSFIKGLDPVTLTLMQSWRVLGSVFMVLYLFDMLPAVFAYPAGLGDVAIGLTAPFVALKLLRDPDYAGSRKFVIWNGLGLFDFVLAVVSGTLASGAFGTALLGGGPTSALMSSLPLAIIPGFIVPLYILLHISALISVRSANVKPY